MKRIGDHRRVTEDLAALPLDMWKGYAFPKVTFMLNWA
jgi:hypothetical protein